MQKGHFMLNPTCFAKPCQTLTIKILSTLFLLMISGWVNAQVAKSTQDLIKELESASATCTGACRTTCSDSATLLADWGTVSGHEQEASIRNINAMYYPLCQLYLRPVARVSNGYFSGISEVVVIKIDAI